ncbi:MAG: discoidin domain-containing protein [Proteobacteria bacterium]|nr:discoidin domain-containing protein [Pseudomonadota bacterium]
MIRMFGQNDDYGIDIGFGKPVQLSTIFGGLPNPYQLLPAGIPGNYSLHTDLEENPSLIVDLNSTRVVKSIRVFNREEWSDRLVPLTVSISDDRETWNDLVNVNYVFGGRVSKTPLEISFHGDHPRFRYLKLVVNKTTYLNLDYIEILAPLPQLTLGRLQNIRTDNTTILAEYCHFDTFGFTWTFTLTLSTIMWCLGYGITVTKVDYSQCLAQFKDVPGIDLYPILFQTPMINIESAEFKQVLFNQHVVYVNTDLSELRRYATIYFDPSEKVREFENQLINKYSLVMEDSIALIYRGTDKNTEVTPATIDRYISVALAARKIDQNLKVIIQTDQEQVLHLVLDAIPDAIFFRELPVTTGSVVIHQLSLREEYKISKTDFSIRMLGVTHLLSQAKYIVSHTGNIGLWLAIYRGNKDGFYQFDVDTDLRDPNGVKISDSDAFR